MKTKTFNIKGKDKEAVWVEKQGHWDAHWEIDGVQFDGHHVLWSFSYEPYTYMKESELSGDAALHLMGRIGTGIRLPLTPLSEVNQARVLAAMRQAGVLA